MDWGNFKNVLTSKLREAEIGIDKFVRNRRGSPSIDKKSSNDSQLNEKVYSKKEDINIREANQNDIMHNGDLAQVKSRYLLAKKILDGKINQLEEKKKYVEKLNILTKYIRNGKPLSIEEIIHEFSAELASVEDKYKKTLKERDKLKKELQMHIDTTSIEDLDAEIAKLKEDEISLQNKSVLLDETITKLKEQLELEENTLNELRMKYKQHQDENAELDKEIDALKEENKKNTQYINNINESIKKSSAQLEDLQKKCKEFDSQINYMQLTFEKAEKEKVELREKLEKTRKENEIEINNLKSSLEDDINKKIQDLKSTHEYNRKILKEEIEDLTSEINTFRNKIKLLEDENYKIIEKLEIELETLELQNNDLSNQSLVENRPLLKQIHELQLKIKEKDEELHKLRDSHQNEINEVENEIDNFTSNFEEIKSTCSKIEDKITAYTKNVHAYQETISSLKEELNYLLSDKESLESEYLSLELIFEEKNKSIIRLKEDINLLNDTYSRLKEEYEEMESGIFNIGKYSSSESLDQIPNNFNSQENNESELNEDTISEDDDDPIQIKINQIDKEIKEIINMITQTKSEYNELESKYVNLFDNKKNKERRLQILTEKAKEFEELEQRHNVTLELLGEKAEIEEQLLDDMQEWKTMYKHQIDVLNNQIECLKSKSK